MTRPGRLPLSALASLLLALSACHFDDPSLKPRDDPRFAAPAPALRSAGRDPLRTIFWGDIHIHSAYSFDAYTLGVRALPDDAYRYAKGETIQHALGYPIRARRPLDFAAVTDHSEYLGVARAEGEASGDANSLREVMRTGSPWRITWHYLKISLGKMGTSKTRDATFGGRPARSSIDAWQAIVDSAERHNDPGRFTTFIAYEWSSMPEEQNLHRNVIYRSERYPDFPYTSLDSKNPEDLWRALDEQRQRGMEMLAIPHNSNASNGKMFDRVAYDGTRLSREYAATRMRNEPLCEIFQVKGSSETHPSLSSADELAGFEIFDKMLSASGSDSQPRGSYARDALRAGLEMAAQSGFNPYRFGFIGSSDSHNASSTVEEDNHHGKLPMIDGSIGLRLGKSLLLPLNQNRGAQWSAAGLAAVWAEENTRESLFDAMKRKETYATSGPRIGVRFFGGWSFDRDILGDAELIRKAYAAGVPMGGDLAPRDGAGAPAFVVTATKDPTGANLDRIQIVKGWVDGDGGSHEKIYDIAASGGRVADAQTHRVPAVGNTVDVERATYTNDIGATQLSALWVDPEFSAAAEAFYYARVIEIPTPRWSTYDAAIAGVTPPQPTSIQERAVTSAIWYRPH